MRPAAGRCRATPPPWNKMALLLITGLAWSAGAWARAAEVVADAPALVILPRNPVQVKPEGRNALLTCRPEGTGANLVTGLRWRAPDGREVVRPSVAAVSKPPVYAERFSSDGSLSLIFQSLTRHDEGMYTCEAQYAGGQDLSRTVEIRVIRAIRWVDAPQEQVARQGAPYKVKCQVEADPPATVDWQKDGAPLAERYRPETDGLAIESASPEDDGVYTCRAIVVATGELQTRAIKLQVQVPPSFADGEQSATLQANRDGTVECHADARPPPTYKWIFKRTGQDLGKQGGRFNVDGITGALHVSPVHADDEGEYSCVASNPSGEAAQVVRVAVQVPPRVKVVRNATRAEGAQAELLCHAFGRPLPSVAWRRHGERNALAPGAQGADPRIATSSRPAGKEHPDRADGILSWDEVKRSDDGLYACVATNPAGEAEDFGHLTVEFKPSFASTPYADYWSWDDQIANITCLAESIPNATIRWFYNNRDLEKDRIPELKKHGAGPQSWLEIPSSFQQRYAAYRCEAKNIHGTESHVINLHKAEKPGPIMQAVFDVVTATTIKFKILGPSNDGGIQTRVYNVRYRRSDELGDQWRTHAWPADSDYTLEDLIPQTRYEFQFSAQNDVGTGPWGATQSIVMPKRSPPEPPPLLDRPLMSEHPEAPVDTPVMSPYPTHFELRWNIPADNGEPITSYSVTWCTARRDDDGHWVQDSSGNCQKKTLIAHPHTTSYRLQPLQPGTLYMVHLHATNSIGTSKPSALLLKTAPGASRAPASSSAAGGGGGRGGVGGASEEAGSSAAALSSAALVAAVVSALLAALLLLDVGCFACRRAGVIAALCERARHRKDAPDADARAAAAAAGLRIGASHAKEPLRDEMRPLTPNYAPSVKRDTSVGFDGKTTAVTRSTFVGKDSAV